MSAPGEPRVVLITGASAGIGRATALAFAAHGDRVGVTARRLDRLEALAAEAADLPGEVVPLEADVRDAIAIQHAVDMLLARYGRLDVLVANAGIGQRGDLVTARWDDLEVVLRTNIDGVLHSVRAAVPAMRRFQRGQIITISSVVGVAITPFATTYAASKAALNALTRGLRVELAPDNIWVTNVLVGQTFSDFAESRRGTPGRVSGLPTMQPGYVARRIVRESLRRRRTVTLRAFDRLLVLAGFYLPRLMDWLAKRAYHSR